MSIIQTLMTAPLLNSGGGDTPATAAGYYFFNSNLNYMSTAGGTNTGYTLYTWPNGDNGNILTFTGNGYQQTPTLGVLNNFWLDFWIYPTSNNISILTETGAPGENLVYYYNMMEINSSGNVLAGVYTGSIPYVTSSNTVTLNAWNHIYFYHDSGTISLSVNNQTASTLSGITRSGPGSSYLAFGQSCPSAIVTSNRYQGYVDYIQMWTTSTASSYNARKTTYGLT